MATDPDALDTNPAYSSSTLGNPTLSNPTLGNSSLSDLSDPDRAELGELAARLAGAAAEMAARMRHQGVEVAAVKSSQTDVVTAADRATENWLRTELARLRPDDGFLGEESERSAGTSGLTWVVDPIDGTVNYLYELDNWAVSVAVVAATPDPEQWHPVAGAVVSPPMGEIYAATAGLGATRNGQALSLRPVTDLSQALIGTGFSYAAAKRTAQAEAVTRLIGQVRDIRRFGAASLDLCAVAAGRLDGYYEAGLHPWDHAAGALIAREAGAFVGGLAGARESRDFLYACNRGLATSFESALIEAGAPDAASIAG